MLTEMWRVTLLGGLRAEQRGMSIDRFRTRKTAGLLAYLAFHAGRRHQRESLATLFWPDASPELALKSLGVALSSLRKLLEPPTVPAGNVVIADRLTALLRREAVQTDVATFDQALVAAAGTADPVERRRHLETALRVYAGDLLPGHYDEWITPERERLALAHRRALNDIVLLLATTNPSDALPYALQAAAADPYDESCCLRAMELRAATGRPTDALRQFADFDRRLMADLGERPSRRLRELAERLRTRPQPATIDADRGAGPADLVVGTDTGKSRSDVAAPSTTVEAQATVEIHLPPLLTRLFGRESDVDRLQELFAGRLTTLTGPGGAGKTRLAIEAARRNATSGRVLFVPLADLAAPAQVPQAIRAALGATEAPGTPVETQLAHALAALPTLLLLDNVEHLISEEASDQAGSLPELALGLLDRVPTLRIVATSRQPLGLSGEQEFPVLPLPVPEAASAEPTDTADAERLLQFACVQLFIDRARLKQPDFQVTPGNVHAVAALCRRLDGVPLALELAAGLSRVMPPAAMLARLDETQDDLVSRQRHVPDRHRSLSSAIEWSYRLLPDALQSFFCRLSVFRGWWTADVARDVCGGTDAIALLALLQDRSLIQSEPHGGGVRFRVLETIRQYAAERLDELGEASDACARHTAYFAARAAANRMGCRMPEIGPRERAALDALEDNYPNFTVAFDRLLASQDAGAAIQMAATLSRFWLLSRRLREGDERVQALLPLARASDEAESMCILLNHGGTLAWFRGDYGRAFANFSELLHVARVHGIRHHEATALHGLGVIAGVGGRSDERDAHLTAAIAILREIGDRSHLAWSLMTFGWLLQNQGLDLEAAAVFRESLAVHSDDDGGSQSGWCHMYLAMLTCRAGEAREADVMARRALAVFHRAGSASGELWMLLHMATIASAAGQPERSAVLAGHVRRLLFRSGIQLPPAEAAEFEQTIAQVEVSLGEDGARAALLHGAALTIVDAMAYALEDASVPLSDRTRTVDERV